MLTSSTTIIFLLMTNENIALLDRLPSEPEAAYIWRVGGLIDQGIFDSWGVIAPIVNTQLGYMNSDRRNADTFRKKYREYKNFYTNVVDVCSPKTDVNNSETDKKEKTVMALMRELEITKTKYRDERNSWQKQNRIQARLEENFTILSDELCNIGRIKFTTPIQSCITSSPNGADLIVLLSDLHIGIEYNSYTGAYSVQIAQNRLEEYLSEVSKKKDLYNAENCYVFLLGDLISGNIHTDLISSNAEDVINQSIIASDIITAFVDKLCGMFSSVHLVSAAGNHSRIAQQKDNALLNERLDNLITYMIKKLLSHKSNFIDDSIVCASGVALQSIRDKQYVAIHGDCDVSGKSGSQNLSSWLGFIPYAVVSGHMHYPAFGEYSNVNMVQCGSLCGSGDNYTIEHRLRCAPSQTILACDSAGIIGSHIIHFSD